MYPRIRGERTCIYSGDRVALVFGTYDGVIHEHRHLARATRGSREMSDEMHVWSFRERGRALKKQMGCAAVVAPACASAGGGEPRRRCGRKVRCRLASSIKYRAACSRW